MTEGLSPPRLLWSDLAGGMGLTSEIPLPGTGKEEGGGERGRWMEGG